MVPDTAQTERRTRDLRPWLIYGAFIAVGAALDTASRHFPTAMPFFLPWEFNWPMYLATGLGLGWYVRGVRRLSPARRPGPLRIALYIIGVLSLYAMLQTHIDFYAQRVFFVHRAAHFVLHHAGAFLIALSWPGAALSAGMPRGLRPALLWRPLSRVVDVLQHPAVAPVLFVGLLYLWLLPSLHTRVMLDSNLYDLMNWSMTINGIMFWCLVLDPRPKPPARLSHLKRGLMILLIELPQMALGAVLSLSRTNYYPVYDICGRVLDVPALSDQHYGGLIIWLPGTLTSFAAMIFVLMTMHHCELRAEARDATKAVGSAAPQPA
ncbi:MAG: cytochrome c oxidase assembly protein [Alphaproteobacteria bacterium]|nr:cytochrome c oxidase assembly protein [Alphaproteobacteria bacterium]